VSLAWLLLTASLVSSPASAVSGWPVDAWGMPVLLADQVYDCPREGGDGRVLMSWENTGARMKRGSCAGDLATGSWKGWYENGTKHWKVDFVTGRMDGKWKAWWDNGQKQAKGSFEAGSKDGLFKHWYQNGKHRAKGHYDDDKEDGCWTEWHENGKRASKGAYADGTKVGRWFLWDEEGHRRKEVYGGEASGGRCWWPLI